MSKAVKKITGHVVDTYRAGTSAMGNPTYDVRIRLASIDGTPVEASCDALRITTLRTQTNSGLAYGITNPEYRDSLHEYTLNAAGKLITAKAV